MRSVSSGFPGFDHLYLLSEGPSGLRGGTEWPGYEYGVDHSLKWLGLTRGEARPDEPVEIVYEMGPHTPGDVVWTTNVFPLDLHRRVIDLLLDHRFTGWSTYPVEVCGKEVEVYPDYVGFAISGRCGPLDGSRSAESSEEMPGGAFPRWVGLYFSEETWDGSDFFMTTDQKGWKFVTEDVVREFKRAKVKGFDFEPLSKVQLDFVPG